MAREDIETAEEKSPLLPAQEARKSGCSKKYCILGVVLAAIVVGVAIGVVIGILVLYPNDGPPPASKTGYYKTAAVATDIPLCSTIGRSILEQGGSAVDAAIAATLCVGVHNSHSTGIGGGNFMMIYDTPVSGGGKVLEALDAREVAPLAATRDMFYNVSSGTGGKAIAVPSEIKGFWEAWSRFGRLPWKSLFEPTIKVCKEGIEVLPSSASNLKSSESSFRYTPSLGEIFLKEDGTVYKEGETYTRPKLAATLETIATEGGDVFYTGQLAEQIVQDIQDHDGIITLEDLQGYKVQWRTPWKIALDSNKWTAYSMPAPGGGPVFQFILKLLDGYDLHKSDVSNASQEVLTYHRILESMKFAMALRTHLADPDFVDVSEVLANLSSPDFANYIRRKIDDSRTHNVSYYGASFFPKSDSGTAHLNILAPDGGAVAITSTINTGYGSRRRGMQTGIIFNDEMDDFSNPWEVNSWGLRPSPANIVEPGKRALSSMAPVMFFDQTGNLTLIMGGSGGSKISTMNSFVAAHHMWLGMTLSEAVDTARVHHQLMPNEVSHETAVSQGLLQGLEKKGHVMASEPSNSIAVVHAIRTRCHEQLDTDTCIEAVSDYRKYGEPDGY